MLCGTGAFPGIGSAPVFKFIPPDLTAYSKEAADPQQEEVLFFRSVRESIERNTRRYEEAKERIGEKAAGIFEAHNGMLEDSDSILDPIAALIREGKSAAAAVDAHFTELASVLEALEDDTLRERAADFRDLRDQLLMRILGIEEQDLSHMPREVILVARELTPSDTINLDLAQIRGIVTEEGGAGSHATILAQALGIPAVVGCRGIMERVHTDQPLLMDGKTGEVIADPTAQQKAEFLQRAETLRKEQDELQPYIHKDTVTKDGVQLKLCANIASAQECGAALEYGCEGVGLFRSEFLYMNRSGLPKEEEQLEAYRQALEAARGRPVTIRTLDAGGDKAVGTLCLPKEENPFLGYRAVRICLGNPDLFQTQLRALYRASVYGQLRIMFPMISSLEELRQCLDACRQARASLDAEGIPYSPSVRLGMMIEIPAAAVMAQELAKEVDFFSIGTNDLVQYAIAVDRGNSNVKHLYSYCYPSVIRLIAHVIRAAHQNGIPCCMCGEAAGDVAFIPVLLGLGLDDFSMAAVKIPAARKLIAGLTRQECSAAAQKVLSAATREEVERILSELQSR